MKVFRRLLFMMILIGMVVLLSNQLNLYSIGRSSYEGQISIMDMNDTTGYIYLSKEKTEISKGELILVNNENSYSSIEEKGLVNVYETKNSSYKVKDLNVNLHSSLMVPLNEMLEEFQNRYGSSAITVISGYRTYNDQKSLYKQRIAEDGEVEAMKWVAKPGESEHHTGYALDFGLYHDSGRSESYKGNGRYRWIDEYAHQYGFVLRYPEEKVEITGIYYEPWHFRYIGKPHAYLVKEYNMCLEEYIDYLRGFLFGDKHLKVIDGDGKGYEIYYTDKLEVPVPSGKPYKISGDNSDGFIITVENY